MLGRELAQSDRNFLEYSVSREDVLSQLRNRARPFYLIVAPRGSGKSGVLLMLEDELERLSKSSAVVIKKYYEDATFPSAPSTIDGSLQYWIKMLLQWVVAEIGVGIEVPETPDEIFAVELAESLGMRERDHGGGRSAGEPESVEALRFIAKRLVAKTDKTFWLLLDEMDDFYSNTEQRDNALVGLLQACDAVTKLSERILARVTIRPHILTYLKTKFGVIQKFRDAELPLHWSEVQLKDILAKRIQYFDHRVGRRQQVLDLPPVGLSEKTTNEIVCSIIGKYFSDFNVGFIAGGSTSYRALQTLSLSRPRWMIEYCWLALQYSPGDYASRESFIRAMHEFGRNRLQFLAGEHHSHLPDLTTWVNRLTAARRSSFGTSEQLREVLVRYVVRADPVEVAERPITSQEDVEALRIAQSLYMLEILRAHQGVGGRDDHRFYTYTDSPELLTSWTTRHNMKWGLHETFARALNVIENPTFRVPGGKIRVFGERKEGGAKKKNRPGSRARKRLGLEGKEPDEPSAS